MVTWLAYKLLTNRMVLIAALVVVGAQLAGIDLLSPVIVWASSALGDFLAGVESWLQQLLSDAFSL